MMSIPYAMQQQSARKKLRSLAVRSEAMIVIGGTNSSNSRKLFDICKISVKTFFYTDSRDLSSIDLSPFARLEYNCWGASTPKYYYTGGSKGHVRRLKFLRKC